MITFINTLNEKMQQEIQEACMETGVLLHRAEQCFYISRRHLLELKDFIAGRGFENQVEEITFFKKLKPSVQKENIYWSEIAYIEANRPAGSRKLLKEYYLSVIEQINIYFQRNRLLYTYYKTGHSDEDMQLFLRDTDCIPLYPESDAIDMDPSFSTLNSSKIAKIMALEEVSAFINQNLDSLCGRSGVDDPPAEHPKPLVWTGTKAQFIEFVYGAHATGVFNNGKATIKDCMDFFQYHLNIRVSNYYGYFQSMRLRKKGRTPYIDYMQEKTVQRMDESDEFPRYS